MQFFYELFAIKIQMELLQQIIQQFPITHQEIEKRTFPHVDYLLGFLGLIEAF